MQEEQQKIIAYHQWPVDLRFQRPFRGRWMFDLSPVANIESQTKQNRERIWFIPQEGI